MGRIFHISQNQSFSFFYEIFIFFIKIMFVYILFSLQFNNSAVSVSDSMDPVLKATCISNHMC